MESCLKTSFSNDVASLERLEKLLSAFKKTFDGQEAEAVVLVPGRVNLIGEHIDYCGYAVHPMAIEQNILVAVRADKSTNSLELANVEEAKYSTFKSNLTSPIEIKKGFPHWWNYFLCGIKGVAEDVLENGATVGMKCMVDGRIPPSAGLSSSSALVVSSALTTAFVNGVNDKRTRSELADLCARSERFIGTQGGGMDQAIELLAEKGSAKLIEFNPLKSTSVQLPDGALFVIANSLAEANKAAGNEFNQRVVECRLACKVLAKSLGLEGWADMMKLKAVQDNAKKSLEEMVATVKSVLHEKPYTKTELAGILGMSEKEIDENVLTENTRQLTEFKLHQRALHVYSEAGRVYEYKNACDTKKPLEELGQLMFDSHYSCSQLYECSHPQLDQLVELSKRHGALGARLTGAGWGGCIVALVPEANLAKFLNGLQKDYYDNLEAAKGKAQAEYLFPTAPGDGANIYKM